MPRSVRVLPLFAVGALLLSGCSFLTAVGPPTSPGTSSPSPVGASTPPTTLPSGTLGSPTLPTSSPGPTPTPTPGPSATPVPIATATPAATPAATPDGPDTPEPTDTTPPGATPSGSPDATTTPEPSQPAKPLATRPVKLSLEMVADGFENANGVFNAGDDRLFVTEQEGYVVVLHPKAEGTFRNGGTFLDIRDRVICCGEKGMLGIAFPPDYAETGKFYVTYAGAGHEWYLDERRVSADDPDRADPDYRRNLISMYKPHDFHWAGDMYFGPDGYLWVSVGDGGFGGGPKDPGDPDDRAQDTSQLFGKLLRIDPHDPDHKGPKRYTIPADNPFVHQHGAAPEIWAYGFRNPWRWSFDSLTGDLWMTDVGMWKYEEVDRAPAPNRGKGANYGWRLMEGTECYNPSSGCERGVELKMPLATYAHGTTPEGFLCAVTGGFVYRGQDYPAMRSWYFFSDYCSGSIFMLDSGGKSHQQPRLGLDTDFTISSMGEDVNGKIYVVDYGRTNAIYRLEGKPAD